MDQTAWWWQKQGLDGALKGAPPAAVLERTGWARSVGGAGPYLTLFARAGTTREAVDQAVANLEIHELPSARGCTYVVPAADFALALKLAQPDSLVPINQAKKYLGVTDQELEILFAAVVDALSATEKPLTPDQLKEACGGAVRNLGEAGKKRGQSTTLPLALGYLQTQGEIRRVPLNGRLDQQRYAYTRWAQNPLQGFTLTPAEAATELARRYWRWIGPATLAEFQWFSGLGVAASKAAVAPLGLVPLENGQLILAGELTEYEAFQGPGQPDCTLVSSLDGLMLLRRDLTALLAPADLAHPVYAEKGGTQAAGGLSDAPFHAIFDRGRLIGFWEYDPGQQAIVWMTFDSELPAGLREAIARTETYAREQLGDVRSFSLDSPAGRAPKIAWLREHTVVGGSSCNS
ncbi:MAG TPA: crosslink repair DNA glycosylase YcaQ family protein [Symbiobacteriaceae bacterium]|jgi:hypothetical protein|nr:crosslink repair DNA glycosylase YcaQ family protein [Symbiobacteriaceae bacterium]